MERRGATKIRHRILLEEKYLYKPPNETTQELILAVSGVVLKLHCNLY